MNSPFHAGGPLGTEDSAIYVVRQGDMDALSWLISPQRAEDLLVAAPRQQGKTSCIYKLMRHPGLINFLFAYADLQNADCTTEGAWYLDLWHELRQSSPFIDTFLQNFQAPTRAREWEMQMRSLAGFVSQSGRRLVIVLDEIGVIKQANARGWASRFFSTVRKLENARENLPALRSLSFIFVGTFHPNDLVSDDNVSPFNSAQRVILPDFTQEETRRLLALGDWSETKTTQIANRIHYWADGQPYITQTLARHLCAEDDSADVDQAATRFMQNDLAHLPSIVKRVRADHRLMEYLQRLETGSKVLFLQHEHGSVESTLELLGVIKADRDGYCTIRNRLYSKSLGLTPKSNSHLPRKTDMSHGPEITPKPSKPTSPAALPAYKRKALEQRLVDLIEEHAAVSDQLRRMLSAADELKLQRQQRHLEEQMAEVEAELGRAPTAPTPSPSVKADKATLVSVHQSDQLYGAGNRWAVLVGANTYEDAYHFGALQVCVKDVEATREQLIAGGFDPARIRLLTDNTDEKPTRANILTALKAMADATEPDDLLLFYYSGHGDEAGGESYLVARDGRHLVLSDTAVPVMRIKQIMDAAPARAKVILLDACHSGADIGKKGPQPMTQEFIARVFEQAEGMAILASCKQGQLSYEWRAQERSVFTHYLLEALKGEADRDGKGFVTVQDASRHVTNGVKLWASQRNVSQTPTLQYSVAGDIIVTRHAKHAEQA